MLAIEKEVFDCFVTIAITTLLTALPVFPSKIISGSAEPNPVQVPNCTALSSSSNLTTTPVSFVTACHPVSALVTVVSCTLPLWSSVPHLMSYSEEASLASESPSMIYLLFPGPR